MCPEPVEGLASPAAAGLGVRDPRHRHRSQAIMGTDHTCRMLALLMRSPRPRPARRPSALLRASGLFVLVSALCGLLVAVIALPAVGGAAFGAKSAQNTLADLPADFDP